MATSPGARGWLFGRVTVPATGGKGGGRGGGKVAWQPCMIGSEGGKGGGGRKGRRESYVINLATVATTKLWLIVRIKWLR